LRPRPKKNIYFGILKIPKKFILPGKFVLDAAKRSLQLRNSLVIILELKVVFTLFAKNVVMKHIKVKKLNKPERMMKNGKSNLL
jgi:hypothetical protein